MYLLVSHFFNLLPSNGLVSPDLTTYHHGHVLDFVISNNWNPSSISISNILTLVFPVH